MHTYLTSHNRQECNVLYVLTICNLPDKAGGSGRMFNLLLDVSSLVKGEEEVEDTPSSTTTAQALALSKADTGR